MPVWFLEILDSHWDGCVYPRDRLVTAELCLGLQVWQLIIFSLFRVNHWFLVGEAIFCSSFNSLILIPWRALWTDTSLKGPSTSHTELLLEHQRYKDTIRCVEQSVGVPGHRHKSNWDKHWLCVFFTLVLDCKKATEQNFVSDQTWGPGPGGGLVGLPLTPTIDFMTPQLSPPRTPLTFVWKIISR